MPSIQMLLVMPSFGPLNSYSLPSVLQCSPVPPADLGPDSLVLTQQRKADPSGSRMVDPGQSLQEWAGGQAEAGNPSISLSPSLCRAPHPHPRTWSHANLHGGVPEEKGEKTGVFILLQLKIQSWSSFLLGVPGNITHHHSQEQGLRMASRGCHSGVLGKIEGGSQGRALKLRLQSFGCKIKIMSVVLKKERGSKWKLWGDFKAPKPTPLVLPSPLAHISLLLGVGHLL